MPSQQTVEPRNWVNAYTFKRRGFIAGNYDIVFDNQRVLVATDRRDAARITAALNGAYNMGRQEVMVACQTQIRDRLQAMGFPV